MRFEHIEFLILLIFVLPMLYLALRVKGGDLSGFSADILAKIRPKSSRGFNSRVRAFLLLFTFALLIVGLSRPQIDRGDIKVKQQSRSLVVGLDISKSMFVSDIYPNRFKFAKAKFLALLDNLKETKVALLGFSSRAFLVSPLTSDYASLKFLANNLKAQSMSLKGTSLLQALVSANDLMKDSKKKAILIFSDGGDSKDFTKEIAYAKEHNIKVFVYLVGTKKGGILKERGRVVKSANGDIVILKSNDAIKELALKSGGAFMKYSLDSNDVKSLAKVLASSLSVQKEESTTIHNRVELFYYPVGLAFIALFMALFSLPKRRDR